MPNAWVALTDGVWSGPANWSEGHVPLPGEDVTFGPTSLKNCTVDVDPPTLATFTMSIAYVGAFSDGGHTFAVTGDLTLAPGPGSAVELTGSWSVGGWITMNSRPTLTLSTITATGPCWTSLAGAVLGAFVVNAPGNTVNLSDTLRASSLTVLAGLFNSQNAAVYVGVGATNPLRLRSATPIRVLASGAWVGTVVMSDAGALAGTILVGGSAATVRSWVATGATFTFPVLPAGTYSIVVITSDGRTDTLVGVVTYVSGQSPLGLIWQNLVDTFNGMTLPYSGADHTLSAQYQRIVEEARGSTPVLVPLLQGVTLLESASRTDKLRARFVLACYLAGINDQAPADPIDKVTREVSAYLVTQLMADITRGGMAVNTDKDAFDHRLIEYVPGDIEQVVLVDCHCDFWVDSANHFQRAA